VVPVVGVGVAVGGEVPLDMVVGVPEAVGNGVNEGKSDSMIVGVLEGDFVAVGNMVAISVRDDVGFWVVFAVVLA
jgi:hypothetical protein